MNTQVIGYVGENGTRDVQIPVGHLLEKWPDLSPSILMVPVGGADDDAYPVNSELVDSNLVWHVSAADTAVTGTTKASVRMTASDGRVALDEPFTVIVSQNLSVGGDPPSPVQSWVDKLEELTPRLEDATEEAVSAANRANDAAKNWESSTAANADKLGGKAPGYYLRPRNLLNNSDFRNPVNQRGITTTSAAGYHLDRWVNVYANPKVTVNAGYVSFNNTSTSSGYRTYQRFPAGTLVAGTTYTAVLKMYGGDTRYAAITMPTSGDKYSSQIENTFYFCLTKTNDFDAFSISVGTGKRLDVEWVALYEGDYTDSPPTYEPKGYAVELLECQRYFIALPTYGDYSLPIAHGVATGTASARLEMSLPVHMRIETPSIDATGVTFYLRSGGASSAASVSVLRSLGNKIFLTATVSSGLTTYQQATLACYGAASKPYYIGFTAEIGEEG